MKKSDLLVIFILGIVITPATVAGETYRGIGLDSLADLKAKFPGAQFRRMNPAWAQPSDVMYSITGAGMSGTIVVTFDDPRPLWRERAEKESDDEHKKLLRQLADESDDEAITVRWVRWIPQNPIPLARLIVKYGAPERSGFSDEDLEPYRTWAKKGVTAYLSDDEKHIIRIDFTFTLEELIAGYGKRWGLQK